MKRSPSQTEAEILLRFYNLKTHLENRKVLFNSFIYTLNTSFYSSNTDLTDLAKTFYFQHILDSNFEHPETVVKSA